MPSSFTAERVRIPLVAPQAVEETSGVLWRPDVDAGRHGVVLAHGAGTDMTNPVLCAVGRGLAGRGYPTLAFNFAYTEAGRRRPDPAERLQSAVRDAVRAAQGLMGDRPIVAGGRSMGGRMASMLAARSIGSAVQGLLLLGYPLHPRKPLASPDPVPEEKLRTAHWPALRVPTLLLQGDRDTLADLDLLRGELAAKLTRAPWALHVVAGGDHGFAVRKADHRSQSDVLAEISGVAADWLDGLQLRGAVRPLAS